MLRNGVRLNLIVQGGNLPVSLIITWSGLYFLVGTEVFMLACLLGAIAVYSWEGLWRCHPASPPVFSGCLGVQKETKASKDQNAWWCSENHHGGWFKNSRRAACHHMQSNRYVSLPWVSWKSILSSHHPKLKLFVFYYVASVLASNWVAFWCNDPVCAVMPATEVFPQLYVLFIMACYQA